MNEWPEFVVDQESELKTFDAGNPIDATGWETVVFQVDDDPTDLAID